MRRELDDSEKRILRALQRNADISINEIAETAALSTASVHRKIRRLKADGIIEKTVRRDFWRKNWSTFNHNIS